MFTSTRIEVLNLGAHLLLAVLIVAAYTILAVLGHPDETLKYAVIGVVSSFFGTVGLGTLKGAATSQKGPAPLPPPPTPPAATAPQENTNTHA